MLWWRLSSDQTKRSGRIKPGKTCRRCTTAIIAIEGGAIRSLWVLASGEGVSSPVFKPINAARERTLQGDDVWQAVLRVGRLVFAPVVGCRLPVAGRVAAGREVIGRLIGREMVQYLSSGDQALAGGEPRRGRAIFG